MRQTVGVLALYCSYLRRSSSAFFMLDYGRTASASGWLAFWVTQSKDPVVLSARLAKSFTCLILFSACSLLVFVPKRPSYSWRWAHGLIGSAAPLVKQRQTLAQTHTVDSNYLPAHHLVAALRSSEARPAAVWCCSLWQPWSARPGGVWLGTTHLFKVELVEMLLFGLFVSPRLCARTARLVHSCGIPFFSLRPSRFTSSFSWSADDQPITCLHLTTSSVSSSCKNYLHVLILYINQFPLWSSLCLQLGASNLSSIPPI